MEDTQEKGVVEGRTSEQLIHGCKVGQDERGGRKGGKEEGREGGVYLEGWRRKAPSRRRDDRDGI